MASEEEFENIWNTFFDKYGCEPKNSNLLLKFAKWEKDLSNINYKTAKIIFNKYKGKGRIRYKTQNTATDIIQSLPTSKAKRNANNQNILTLASIFKLQLLINGYIRNMNENETFKYIIPSIISHLCLNYCHLPNIIISINKLKEIQITDLIHQKVCKCKLNQLNNDNSSASHEKLPWSMSSGVCYKKSVKLPAQITKTYGHKSADIIFQSQQKYSNAILFDFTSIEYENDNKFDLYEYHLPLINYANRAREFIGNSLCFDQDIGLISIGGGSKKYPYSKNLHLLKWKDINHQENEKWKWEMLPSLLFDRGQSASICVEDKVMIISGHTVVLDEDYSGRVKASYRFQNTVELYDLTSKKSKLIAALNKPRSQAGVCYDKCTKTVFVGGGHVTYNKCNTVESYDTVKNKWYCSIPKTLKHHKNFPILWTQNNGDLLFIGSLQANVIEFIDLRVYRATWNIMYTDNGDEKQSLLKIFATIGNSSYYTGRLLK